MAFLLENEPGIRHSVVKNWVVCMRYKITKLLSIAALVGACACNSESLSLGELRCVNARCGTHEVHEVPAQRVEARASTFEEPAIAHTVELPCSANACQHYVFRAIPLGEPDEMLVATFRQESDDGVLVLYRYRGTSLEWQHDLARAEYMGVLELALAPGDEPGSALVIAHHIVEEPEPAAVLRIQEVAADGSIDLLFEESDLGSPFDAARIGDDLLIATYAEAPGEVSHDDRTLYVNYIPGCEISRYTLDGELLWRQSMFDGVGPGQGSTGTTNGPWRMRVLDHERIAVLIPRGSDYEVAVLDADSGNVLWGALVPLPNDRLSTFSALLAIGPNGQIITGTDGYVLQTIDADGHDRPSYQVARARLEFFTHAVDGLLTDADGFIYVATHEGDANDERHVIDRYSPDLLERTSLRIEEPAALKDCGSPFNRSSELHLRADGRGAFAINGGCFTHIEFPAGFTRK